MEVNRLIFGFVWRKTDYPFLVWRIVVGISLVPAFGTLYQRLTLPESTRYIAAQKLKSGEEGDAIAEIKRAQLGESRDGKVEESIQISSIDDDKAPEELATKKAQFTGTFQEIYTKSRLKSCVSSVEFLEYFSEWKHAKILLGTCMCWFFLDIALVSSLNCLRTSLDSDSDFYLLIVSMASTSTKMLFFNKSNLTARQVPPGTAYSKSAPETLSSPLSVSSQVCSIFYPRLLAADYASNRVLCYDSDN